MDCLGSAVGAVPFITVYIVPLLVGAVPSYAEYSAVLLGCVPLSFASALVRYRLMDIEVIIKRVLLVGAVAVLLAGIYSGTLWLVALVLGTDNDRSSFWALLATLVVALVAPPLWNAIRTALDRLYYRDRYDYRRALVAFARELNSDLDLHRLSNKLVDRVRETLAVERIALYLVAEGRTDRFAPVAAGGCAVMDLRPVEPRSELGTRLAAGQTVVVDDPITSRRLPLPETALWREAGLTVFVPCISNDVTIAFIALGHRPDGEPLNSEDMALLGAVAAQAATALENARLYNQLSAKASEIERLRQFSDSVVESLSDGLIVVDLEDRVLRWNRRIETWSGSSARGRSGPTGAIFETPFLATLHAARRESPAARRCTACRSTWRPGRKPAAAQHRRRAVPDRRRIADRLDHRARGRHRPREPRGAAAALGEDGGDRAPGRRRGARGEHAAHGHLELHADAARSRGARRSEDAAAREDRAADVPGREDRQQPAEPGAPPAARCGWSTSTASSATCCPCSSISSRRRIQVRRDLDDSG